MFAAADSDDEIAAVLTHEIAHLVARHSEEQASKKLIGCLAMLPAIPFLAPLLLVADVAFLPLLGLAVPPLALAVPPLALGVWLLLLASDRNYEPKADDIGQLLMAEAGFDPRAAISFWNKMNRLERRDLGANARLHEYWKSEHPHDSPSISRTASNVWKALYMTGNGPLQPDLSSREVQELEKIKRRWEAFLRQRPPQAINSIGA
ncbi:MAG: hypothetical protein Q9199_001662 [Rusavskia elegans]